MAPIKRERRREEQILPFDMTQEIDPAFAELLRREAEPTLTEADFEALASELSRERR